MASDVANKYTQICNALKALKFKPEIINMSDWIDLWNLRNKYPLEHDFIYGESVVNGRSIAIEIYFIVDTGEIEAVLQTKNRLYNNDFQKVPDINSLIQFIYSWLQNEKRY